MFFEVESAETPEQQPGTANGKHKIKASGADSKLSEDID
jgi:hypothetical protein